MTKTEARLALAQRQRRFEWELAREEQTRAAAKLVAGKTHDFMNLIQIVQLASLELAMRVDDRGKEFVTDLQRAADDAQLSMRELMAVARPDVVIARGAPVGPAVAAALATLRPAIEVDIHLAPPPDTATRCSAQELEHLLIGLALDAIDDDPVAERRIELFVRQRAIDGKPWIEILRTTTEPLPPEDERFELRAVIAIAQRAGGEVASSERRGGGVELIVALPVV
ncbi:MAG TPA: hypothetical protein VFQ53_39455 [Kofleriaceae bacterium]|nr:hypothetical protein [Kofleriaceae bacterium]